MNASIETQIIDLATLTTPEIQQAALAARARSIMTFDRAMNAELNHRNENWRLCSEYVTTIYLQAVNAVREASTTIALEALRDTLTDRLSKGMELDPTPARDRLWLRLMAEYEIVEDALSSNAIWRYQDRIREQWH